MIGRKDSTTSEIRSLKKQYKETDIEKDRHRETKIVQFDLGATTTSQTHLVMRSFNRPQLTPSYLISLHQLTTLDSHYVISCSHHSQESENNTIPSIPL